MLFGRLSRLRYKVVKSGIDQTKFWVNVHRVVPFPCTNQSSKHLVVEHNWCHHIFSTLFLNWRYPFFAIACAGDFYAPDFSQFPSNNLNLSDSATVVNTDLLLVPSDPGAFGYATTLHPVLLTKDPSTNIAAGNCLPGFSFSTAFSFQLNATSVHASGFVFTMNSVPYGSGKDGGEADSSCLCVGCRSIYSKTMEINCSSHVMFIMIHYILRDTIMQMGIFLTFFSFLFPFCMRFIPIFS